MKGDNVKALVGLGIVALALYGCLNSGSKDDKRAKETPAPATTAEEPKSEPPKPVDLSSTARCGCRLAKGDRYDQPEECRLPKTPDVVGLEGYVRTATPMKDLGEPPWGTQEYRQTGPSKFDPRPSPRKARTRVRILEVHMRESPYDNLLDALVKVRDVAGSNPRTSWIDMADFDAVPWMKCPADKAIAYSSIMARPKPGSRPVDDEGRWIDDPAPKKVWCWYFIESAGVYCHASKAPRPANERTWVYKPGELEVTY